MKIAALDALQDEYEAFLLSNDQLVPHVAQISHFPSRPHAPRFGFSGTHKWKAIPSDLISTQESSFLREYDAVFVIFVDAIAYSARNTKAMA